MVNLTISEILIRLFASAVAGGLIGYEREIRGNDAGLRTHVLVALGACVFALIQVEIAYFSINLNKEISGITATVDMTRIVAQVVSGVGFLGAGSIILTKSKVRGLTTAASIWATAALGIGFGFGLFLSMILSTIMILITLVLLKRLFRTPSPMSFEVRYREQPELSNKIIEYFRIQKVPILNSNYYYELKDKVVHHVNHYTIDTSKIKYKSIFFEGLFLVGEIDEIKSLYLDED